MQDGYSISKEISSVKSPRVGRFFDLDAKGKKRFIPLVTTHISEKDSDIFDLFRFELYSCSVRILRPYWGPVIFKRGKRRAIDSFSWASKRRLRFTAANALPALISQFGMTYHKRNPSGREVKKHLHNFLIQLVSEYPEIGYLWILEFQRRGVVHLHLWLTYPVSPGLHRFMAELWHRIAEPESAYHLWWHLRDGSRNPKENNFIPWGMRSAGYLCKYLDKEHQKRVPDGFGEVGRFWGASRGLVQAQGIVTDIELDNSFPHVSWKPSKMILRTVCKSQEKKIKRKTRWTNQGRKAGRNYTVLEGRSIYEGLVEYHKKQSPF